MHAKTIKKTFRGFLVSSLGLWRVSNMDMTGKLEGHSMFLGYTNVLRMSPAIPYPKNCDENNRNTPRPPLSFAP